MKKIFMVLFVLVAVLSFSICAVADTKKHIITEEQEYIVMGSVKDIKDGAVILAVDKVLQHSDSELVGTDITVEDFKYTYCINHAPNDFNDPVISDNVVVSLDYSDDKYVIKNGAFKVDSIEYSSCKILKHIGEENEECIKTLAEITCFIRSDGKVKEFTFDKSGSIYAVYPQSMEQCIVSVNDDGQLLEDKVVETADSTVNNTVAPAETAENKDYKWIYASALFVVGSIFGLMVALWVAKKKARTNN